MKAAIIKTITAMLAAAALTACKGDGTLLDLYPMEPIVNPEVRTLIQDNRIVYARLSARNQVSGITEMGGFSSADKFRSFSFDPYPWPAESGVVGFGEGLVAHAVPDGRSFILRYSEDNGKTWMTHDRPVMDDGDLSLGAVYVSKLLIRPGGAVWLLCQQHLGPVRRVLLYRVDWVAGTSTLMLMKDNAIALDIDVIDGEQRAWLLYAEQHGQAGNVQMLKTADGGGAWSAVSSLSGIADPHIEAVDADRLLVYNQAGQALHSADGGSSFTPISLGEGGITSCQAVSADVVYALLTGGLAKSNDGGGTWFALDTRVHGIDITGMSLHFYSERQGIVYEGDRLFITDDGGNSWDVLIYPYPYIVE